MAGHVRGAALMPPLGAQDLVEIHELLARFGHVFDNGDADGMGEVLTEDGVVEGVIGAGYTISGLPAAKESTRRRRPDTPEHNTVGTIVFVDAQGVVRARSRYLAPFVDGSVHAGDFFDILRRTPEGWRISYRISVPRRPALPINPPPPEFFDAWRPRAGDLGVSRGDAATVQLVDNAPRTTGTRCG
ncbi:nuclear transport factor 2 family protein [Frankia tisae]|uniref:nuclear transport factor 2 family protein n=1 Tax=Frankia tisae TaxID=2950104 RepID=UPI0021C2515F|nr:nuclear transport factor 2 family protein [Frankia tisae]